ncbi:MAG: acyl-CoA dehydrogenase family protein, partial [Bdellovibrionales bacterium]|nr:acyl-CoA dehydrogenase family protein [Bdellovibrionales bacterium]
MTEADSGSDPSSMQTTAKKVAKGWELSGSKLWITNAHEAGLFLVFATTDASKGYKGIDAFLVERSFPGFKVGKKEDLPFQEHFYIEETLKDGSVMIPMVGYKLKYFRLENVKNENDETTHRLTEIEVPSKAGASHVRVDYSSKEVFEPILKIDIFPKNLFRGEWYFAETVVDTALSSANSIGQNLNEDYTFGMATKVRFYCRENELRVLSLSQDERLQKRERGSDGILREVTRPASAQDLPCSASDGVDLKLASAVQIPISWVDYRLKSEGMDRSLKAEKATDRSYSERPYLEMKLAATKSNSVGGANVRLLNVEVDENYFGYTLLIGGGNSGAKIRFSFLRSGPKNRPAYTARPHFKEDRKVFGFFTTSRPFIADWEYTTEQDFDRRIMMNRFNPNNTSNGGEIQFHFSANTPSWLREVGASAVDAWDKAFQEAFKGSGRTMRVKLGQGDVQLGDLRYNVINLIDQLQESNLFGFGPSISDPDSGEIISATSNVHVGSIRSSVIAAIRAYLITRAEGRKLISFTSTEPVVETIVLDAVSENRIKKLKNSTASLEQKISSTTGAGSLTDAKNLRVELQNAMESGLGR